MATKKLLRSPAQRLQELETTFDYRKELQKQRAIVAVKLREIKAPQSTLRLESRAEVVAEGRGNLLGEQLRKPATGWRLRGW